MFKIAEKIKQGLHGRPLDVEASRFQLYGAPHLDIVVIVAASHMTGKAVIMLLCNKEAHQRLYQAGGSVLQMPYEHCAYPLGIPPMDVKAFALDVESLTGHEIWLQCLPQNRGENAPNDPEPEFSFLEMPMGKQFIAAFPVWYHDVMHVLGISLSKKE